MVDYSKKHRIDRGKTKMNSYENTFITRQDLTKSQSEKLVGKYEDIIKNNSGKVLKVEEWGIRPLSYQIRNNF